MADQVTPPEPITPVGDPKGQAPGGVTWEEAFREATATRDRIKAEHRIAQGELEKYRAKDAELQKQNASAQEKAKLEQLEQQGKYQEALKLTEEKGRQEAEKIRARVAERLIPMAIKSAASKIPNLAKESIDDLPQLLRDRVALDPETLEMFVKGDDGKPMVDEKLTPVPVEKFVENWIQGKPYLLIDGMPKRHGQAAGQGKAYSFEKAMNDKAMEASWKAEDPDGYAEAEKNYWSPGEVKARLRANLVRK
jgi:hypothetical protein